MAAAAAGVIHSGDVQPPLVTALLKQRLNDDALQGPCVFAS
jgi:hypothetical protein